MRSINRRSSNLPTQDFANQKLAHLLGAGHRGLAKNTAHVVTLFALSNLWMARRQLMAMSAAVRPKTA
jgi:IS5 family transposase